MQTAENSTVIRFGPFEADLRTRELRRNGLKLQEQPFQVLVMLLERAGELVTREEIRAKLWPQDTFLDFGSTGISLARAEAVASDKNRVLPTLGTVASVMREKLGESLSTVRDFDAPIEQVTTPSLEALKAYGIGSRALVGQNYDTSIASFQHAIALDPNFAMAYARLGAALASLDIPADRYLAKAYSLRNRVSEREGFYISSHYFHVAVGDLQSASQVYGLWARTYPQDQEPPGDLGVLYMNWGSMTRRSGPFVTRSICPLRTRWTTPTSPDAISTSIAPIRQRRHWKRLGLGESTPQDFAPGALQ